MTDDALADRISTTARMLHAAAIEAAMIVTADGRIGSDNAAALLALAPGTLRNWRATGRGPVAYKFPVAGAQVSYRIADLAAWIEVERLE